MTRGASDDAATVVGPAARTTAPPGGDGPREGAPRLVARVAARAARWWARFSPAGLVGALVLFAAALGPSLMPRSPVYQGAIAGVCAAIGYAVGTFAGWGARRIGLRAPWPPARRVLVHRVTAALALLVVAAALLVDADWQARSRGLLDMGPAAPARPLQVVALAVALGLLLVLLARALRATALAVARLAGRLLPPVPARLVAVVVVGVAAYLVLDGTVVAGLRHVLTTTYAALDEETFPGDEQPTDPERSGSPASLAAWDSLGREGRRFVAGGPDVDELARFSAATGLEREVREPVRVYAGLDTDADLDQVAALVVAELDRTDAWDRSVLVVTTTTGTGWVDPASAAAVELLWGGDTAVAAMQYSYLPSWVSFVGDRATPPAAGRALFEAVYARWSQLPPDDRPALYPSGISLGSFGSQGAFASLSDVAARTSGAVWAGTPGFTPLWSELTSDRDAGSREVYPVLDGGRTVRWGRTLPDDSASLADGDAEWRHPRVVYLQHPSDGVTWWSPDLVLDRPDWLREPRGADVLPDVSWFPVATFFRVVIDLFVAGEAPPGHGHTFVGEYADAWAAVAPPPGWTPTATALLHTALDAPQDTSVADR
ncbi:alpha/beta hydrolase [Cellulomonas wangsupingiae]|uniref:Alpha/beta hydrolase n=1 Tax=Cellulomonas wangsupingiae TaxID=2968085 RepID=A0ABY5K5T2_9CELL|nr:alpha/beta hydrolase [Cellulomonas wangsupingiae]MCC2336693.1 alpha/beta hydrolase [Cellulomonas wangsupingiae]UUI63818.1 alpha/beta hydrolase [Cellulomonas wangsupingiae]